MPETVKSKTSERESKCEEKSFCELLRGLLVDWNVIYRDEGDSRLATDRIFTTASFLLQNPRLWWSLYADTIRRGLAFAQGNVDNLRGAGPGLLEIEGMVSHEEDSEDLLYFVANPIVSWFLCTHRSVKFSAKIGGVINGSPDRLPEDESFFRMLAMSSNKSEVKMRPAEYLLQAEYGSKNCRSAAESLRLVDEAIVEHATHNLLVRWATIPTRWRYYILRDLGLMKFIDEGLEASLPDFASLAVHLVHQATVDIAHSKEGPPTLKLSLEVLLRILGDVGVVLLPSFEFHGTELQELIHSSSRTSDRDKKHRCLQLLKAIRHAQSLSTDSRRDREFALAILRGSCTSRAPEDLHHWMPNAAVGDILDHLPVEISVRDESGAQIYQNLASEGASSTRCDVDTRRRDLEIMVSDSGVSSAIEESVTDAGVNRILVSRRRTPRPDNGAPYIVEVAMDLTEQLKVQDCFSQAIDGVGIGAWRRCLTTGDTWYSRSWREMLGYSEAELPNDYCSWKDNVHPKDLERVMHAYREYVSGNTDRYSIEYRMRHKQEGRFVWLHAKGQLLKPYGEDGPEVFAGVHVDITNTKDSATFKSEALEAMEGVYVFVKDADLRFRYANRSLCSELQTPLSELKGKTDNELFPDTRNVRLFNEADRSVLASATLRQFGASLHQPNRLCIAEEYFDAADGTRRWLATIKQPLFRSSGEIELLGIAVDITEFRSLKMYHSALMNATEDLVYVKGIDGRFREVNRAFADSVELAPEAIVGKTDQDVFPSDLAEEWREEERQLTRTGVTVGQKQPRLVRDKHGNASIRMISKIPVIDRNGSVEAIVGICRDFSEVINRRDELWRRVGFVRERLHRCESNIFIKDLYGRYIAWSPPFRERHLGISAGDLFGRSDYDFWSVDQAERYRRDDERVRREKRSIGPYIEEQESGIRTSTLLTLKSPLLDSSGDVLGVLGVYTDLTTAVQGRGSTATLGAGTELGRLVSLIQNLWNRALDPVDVV